MDIRIMTFNIQHCALHQTHLDGLPEVIEPAAMTAVIEEVGADICGLNEVRGLGKTPRYTAQAEKMAALLGWHGIFGRSLFINGTEPYGNAVVSRWPIEKMEVFHIPDPLFPENKRHVEHRSILRCEFAIGGGFAVYQSHFGLNPAEQEHAVSLAHQLLSAEKLPAVLMGDFNMTPDNPMLAPLLRDFASSAAMLEGQFTHPTEDPDVMIDYILANDKVKLNACAIRHGVVSDHCPVWADITF
ncbi:MAG: endonuclease/exonuclease/phosphatase family protein [Clostridia bacterium]|nr:endonuclease/exonuclease/phosphatase family protein [Clostridia bacterium]